MMMILMMMMENNLLLISSRARLYYDLLPYVFLVLLDLRTHQANSFIVVTSV